MKAYLTTYCNKAHSLETGAPIGHECKKLPPAMLEAEREGKLSEALAIIQTAGELPIHRGLHVMGARKSYRTRKDGSRGR